MWWKPLYIVWWKNELRRQYLETYLLRSICYVTLLVYFLTIASLTACEIMNSKVAGSIHADVPVNRRK